MKFRKTFPYISALPLILYRLLPTLHPPGLPLDSSIPAAPLLNITASHHKDTTDKTIITQIPTPAL